MLTLCVQLTGNPPLPWQEEGVANILLAKRGRRKKLDPDYQTILLAGRHATSPCVTSCFNVIAILHQHPAVCDDDVGDCLDDVDVDRLDDYDGGSGATQPLTM